MRANDDLDPLEPVEPSRAAKRSRRRLRWALAAAVLFALAAIPLGYSRLEFAPLWHDVLGVDVSAHQGDIDWERLARSRVSFAYLKATEGVDFRDARFQENWAASRRAGIRRGAYHYFTNCGSGLAQARNFIAAVPWEPEALPPVVDAEHMAPCRSGPSMSAPATELRTFVGVLEARYGRRPVVYTTREFDATYLRKDLMGESFWVRSLFLPPRFRSDEWILWQYHHRGRRPGIAGPVDLDAFRGTRGDFEAWAAGAEAAPPGSAAAIDRAALATRDARNLYRRDGRVVLYGQRTNGADTNHGNWACAKVVSLVLREAGVDLEVQLAVAGIERALSAWQKVTSERDLRPGDVVVWTNRFRRARDGRCTGGGTCHVGIVTTQGHFHNDPLGDSPTFNGVGLLGFEFKVGFRPPAQDVSPAAPLSHSAGAFPPRAHAAPAD